MYIFRYILGLHGEGSTFNALFGLFLWDAIYEGDVPDVFQSHYQGAPLDLDSDHFYISRQKAIDTRLEQIKAWTHHEACTWVAQKWEMHQGKCSIVDWERFKGINHLKVGLFVWKIL